MQCQKTCVTEFASVQLKLKNIEFDTLHPFIHKDVTVLETDFDRLFQ
jgi:hypothetical protein